ncbi:MAG: SusC/RagA family TonB-linked outer membrane protein [Bacteroidota bacterium]
MRKLITMLLCVVFAATQVSAQTRTLKGRVTDDKSNPVANVTVAVKGTTMGTTTNASGDFTIGVPASAKTLVIRSLGFATQEIAITSSNSYGVSLKPAAENLEEVVVTGYSREKKGQFTGAATVLNASKTVGDVPVGAFDQALQGRVAGMLVNSGSGQPGASANVTIRGIQSIQGAGVQPLYVLDGVPLPAGDFSTINPDDFESITVLKDASAAALYGARGGLGVIVITTKKGKAGTTSFQYRTQYGFTQKPDFSRLNLMNTKEMLQYEEREKLAGTPGWNYSPLNPAIPTGMTAASKQATLDSIARIDVNYNDIFYRQGISQTHEMNMSGGTDRTRFYLSAGYFDQQGIDLASYLKRYTVRFNIDHTADKLTVQFNTTAGYSQSSFAEGDQLGNSPRNPFQMTYRAKTYENPYKADGTLNFGSSSNLALKQVANLLEGIQNSSRNTNQIKINTGLTLAYKILPSLTLKNTLGVDVSRTEESRYINANSYIGSLQSFQSGLAQEGGKTTSQFINTSSLVFAKRINNIHDLELGAYFEVVRGYQKASGFTLYNLDPRLTQTGQGAGTLPTGGSATYPQNATSAKSGYGIRSYFATVRYTYNNKYTLTGNIRRDGTSRIANEQNREITTWSGGAIWNAISENFMRDQKILTDLKFRGSYGIVPNIGSIGAGSYGTYLNSVTNYQGPQIPSFGTTSYVGSPITGLVPTTPGNPDLKIEKIKKLNVGVDLAVWNNRARLSVDAYWNRTVDLFVSQPLSGTTGFGSLNINAGVMTNKGFEFAASVDVVRQRDLNVTLGWNHSINKNNIEDLGLVNEYFLGTFVIRKGLPYGSHYTYNYLGADPATGQPTYETADGKTTFDIAKAGQFAKFGTYLPKHEGGATVDVRWKAITISAVFSYQFDVVRSDNTRNWITRGTPGYQTAVRGSRELLTMQWTKPGDIALYQSSAYDRGFTSSDLADAKFLRFRNLTVGYDLPKINKLISGGRFYVQAQNLAIWSPWKGLDPEDDNNISLNEYPNPKMIVVGLDIKF